MLPMFPWDMTGARMGLFGSIAEEGGAIGEAFIDGVLEDIGRPPGPPDPPPVLSPLGAGDLGRRLSISVTLIEIPVC